MEKFLIWQRRNENLLFYLLLLINLIPVLSSKIFTTGDGGPHLYNALLIDQLISGPKSIINNFYKLNNEVVPNWMGHIILFALRPLVDGWLAEKILQLTYLIFLPITFRWFIKGINETPNLIYWFIFPFCYTFNFYCGFYNFLFALIFMFLILGLWLRWIDKLNFKKGVLFFLLFTLLFLSHLFVFGITLIIICVYTVFHVMNKNHINRFDFKLLPLYLIRKGFFVLIASSFGLYFSYAYFHARQNGSPIYLDHKELWNWLWVIRPLIVFSFTHESKATIFITCLFIILILVQLIARVDFKKEKLNNIKIGYWNSTDVWLAIALIMALLFFYLPDGDGYAGFILLRVSTLLFIFLICWFSTQQYKRSILILSGIVFIVSNTLLLSMHTKDHKDLSKSAELISDVVKHIKPYSVVLPIYWSSHWMKYNYLNYAGADKPMVLLENYECGTGYFPVKWNDENIPNVKLGEVPKSLTCLNWKTNEKSPYSISIDYVMVFGEMNYNEDSCRSKVQKTINKYYSLIYKNDEMKLYKLIDKQ